MRAGAYGVTTALRGQLGGKQVMHPTAQVLAIARAILHKGDVHVGQQVEVVVVRGGNRFDGGRARPQIAPVPDARGEGIGVADQQAVGLARGQIFAPALLGGDVGELGARPLVILTACQFGCRVFAAILRYPDGAVVLRQRAGQRRRAARLGADNADAPA